MAHTAIQVAPVRTARRRVHVVPHTHWDREWYLPFQSFRMRLVDVLDGLLPRMEADPAYGRFLLDGQLAVVDDYLAVRPEAADSIRRLVGSGRLSIGPWYTLPDEFLVSGETLVRNLQLGLRRAAHFGGAMQVGYLPDMFGHIAQMPQILRQFGFDDAVVWRGVPAAITRSGFWWEAPDGSTVRAEYLPQGYGNGAALPDDAQALVRQVDEFATLWDELLAGAPILWMNGTDHQAPQSWLGRVVAEVDATQDDYDLVVTSLPEHLATVPRDGLPTWTGELRSGARSNLLMGVTSNRVDIRRAAARAERDLERLAEPLSALFLPPERWPGALLDEAWLGVIRNAAHDSVCGCSVDEVCDAVLHRYAEASQIAGGLARQARRELARRVDHDGPVVINPSARPRWGLVELVLPGETAPAGTQLVEATAAEQVTLEGPVSLVVPAAEEVNWDATVEAFVLETGDGTPLVASDRTGGELITSGVRAALAAVDHPGPVRLRVRRRPMVRVLAPVDEVPGYGWAAWSLASSAGPEPVRVGRDSASMTNGLVTVEADPNTGMFALDGHGGLGRLVDGGDCGDTYNWCPPSDDTVVEMPAAVVVTVAERGPLRARLVIRSTYLWPERCQWLDRDGTPRPGPSGGSSTRRVGEVPHVVTTTLELRAGERFVRAEVTVDNRSRDHRLRLHLPLPRPAGRSRAECAFVTIERGLDAEGGPTEPALPTYPAHRFVQAGGLTVVHDGVTEYELVGGGDAGSSASPASELALTLLRCTGMLSQGPMATRPLPAGPLIPTEGSQVLKTTTARLALAVGDEVDPYALADEVLVPLQVTDRAADTGRGPSRGNGASAHRPPHPSPLPARGSALTIEGAEVSAVYREGGGLRARVVNTSDRPTTVTVAGRHGWLVDLRDRPLEPFDQRIELRPWAIATLAIAE